MLPKIVNPSDFRRNLADFLAMAKNNLVVIKGNDTNRVLMDETEFNRLSALAHQFELEDPEGKYRPEFVKEVLELSKNYEVDESVESISDLL